MLLFPFTSLAVAFVCKAAATAIPAPSSTVQHNNIDTTQEIITMQGVSSGSASATVVPLVFDSVTVIDVQNGHERRAQRVVIVGHRIRVVGDVDKVSVPKGARVIPAAGKYLIPGLWDMHVHPGRATKTIYPQFIAYGITGIRDAGSPVPLDTLRLWRREILAGTRIGPPRQLLSGQSITGPWPDCARNDPERLASDQTCVKDSADAVHYVDSLKAAGADMIKPREIQTHAIYIAVAAEARRVGLPFGGHLGPMTEVGASDQGASIIDHEWGDAECAYKKSAVDLNALPGTSDALKRTLMEYGIKASEQDRGLRHGDPVLETCWQQAAERFRKNGTWFVPTLVIHGNQPIELLTLANFRAGVRFLAGTDCGPDGNDPCGATLHQELQRFVQQGLTPLEALQTATLDPALMWHATDSLGTVAPGKLADLVLLDANPLTDIQNTLKIRAVVANGRYFDRPALDHLLAQGDRR